MPYEKPPKAGNDVAGGRSHDASTAGERANDVDLVARIIDRDPTAFEQLMRAYNTALFRAARSVVRNDADAEDVLQDAYISIYAHLASFRGDARLSTWLTRIVINQALGRLRRRRREGVVMQPDDRDGADADRPERADLQRSPETPEVGAARMQMRRLLERRIDALPLAFRTAFILREVEEMPIDEVARSLAIPEATVRTRLFRARALLRASLADDMGGATCDVFGFAGDRCDRIVAAVLARLPGPGILPPAPEPV